MARLVIHILQLDEKEPWEEGEGCAVAAQARARRTRLNANYGDISRRVTYGAMVFFTASRTGPLAASSSSTTCSPRLVLFHLSTIARELAQRRRGVRGVRAEHARRERDVLLRDAAHGRRGAAEDVGDLHVVQGPRRDRRLGGSSRGKPVQVDIRPTPR